MWRFIVASETSKDPGMLDALASRDKSLIRYTRYLRMPGNVFRPRSYISKGYTGEYEAEMIHNEHNQFGSIRWMLEAYLMTDATDAEIADRFELEYGAETIRVFRNVFFDTSHVSKKDTAILSKVLAPARATGGDYQNNIWKMIGSQFGADGVDQIIRFNVRGEPYDSALQDWYEGLKRLHFEEHVAIQATKIQQGLTEDVVRTILATHSILAGEAKAQLNKAATSGHMYDAAGKILGAFNHIMHDDVTDQRVATNTSAVEPPLGLDWSAPAELEPV